MIRFKGERLGQVVVAVAVPWMVLISILIIVSVTNDTAFVGDDGSQEAFEHAITNHLIKERVVHEAVQAFQRDGYAIVPDAFPSLIAPDLLKAAKRAQTQ